MSESERQLLLPRTRTNRDELPFSFPVGPGNRRGLGISPGGYSWERRISEHSNRSVGRPPHSDSRMRILSETSSGEESAPNPQRRPFHYNRHTQSRVSQSDLHSSDPHEQVQFIRNNYYNRLQTHNGINLNVLSMPDHVLPVQFYQLQFLGVTPDEGKQSSIVTIAAIWNTMMGTSLLAMPWALMQAGLVNGLVWMAVIAALCLYTAYRIIQVYAVHSRTHQISEFNDLCGLLLGRWASSLATVFSVLAVLGAAIVYWVLLSNFLYSTVDYIYESSGHSNQTHPTGVYCPMNATSSEVPGNSTGPGDSVFDEIWGQFSTVPLFLIPLMFPLIMLKSPTFFTKFNALGTCSIMFILVSMLYQCYGWGINANFSDVTAEDYIPLFKSNFPSLTGILTLALFIHNAIITIMSNNEHQENNGRDMTIAYMLVTGTYMLLGGAFYICFPLPKICIEDNLLNNFHMFYGLTVAAKVFLFFQMMTVFPLIMYLLRVSVLYTLYNTAWPSMGHVLALNTSIITICVLFAIYLPNIGTVLRFSGAACGLVIIFALPILVYLEHQRRQGRISKQSLICHFAIILLGVANFIAQFFI